MANFRNADELVIGDWAGRELVLRKNLSHLQVPETLVLEALSSTAASRAPGQGVEVITHEFDKEVGFQEVVATRNGDQVFYAPRTDRSGRARFDSRTNQVRYARWVVGREQPLTRLITVVLLSGCEEGPNGLPLIVLASYFGDRCALEPGDPKATDSDKDWWFNPRTGQGHAFVVPLRLDQITEECPW